ncbi:MAG: glycerol kinase GlpK [Deltaproteobacteria bacterium]|nr:glycerol kinase GlpK [Deltaproteobacteria bacterium]
MRYILGIDQGTTGSTAMLLDEAMMVVASVGVEFEQHYPRPGWVEHDPSQIWDSVGEAVTGALEKASVAGSDVAAIGITNQRETTVLWDRTSGQPVHPAIVWQCRRTADMCGALKGRGLEPLFRERTGLVLDPYFSGTKAAWILDNVDGLRGRAASGAIAFGTIDAFLVWRLTGGKVHATDPSNASRTLMYDLRSGTWDLDLLEALDVPCEVLPEVLPSSHVYGTTRGLGFLPDGIPVAGVIGDQQAALFGQACFEPGDAKCTYGTGAFMLMNTGGTAVASEAGLLTTVAWRIGDETTYALEGSCFIAGAAVQWLRDALEVIGSSGEVEALAAGAEPLSEVVFVPALAGLGAPHWDPHARGAVLGLTRGAGRAELARAVLEGMALQIRDLALAMEKDAGRELAAMRVDGGACVNDLLMQFQADVLERTIVRPRVVETTGLGSMLLAGLATGVFEGLDAIRRSWKQDRRFAPSMDDEQRNRVVARWEKAVAAVRSFGSGAPLS